MESTTSTLLSSVPAPSHTPLPFWIEEAPTGLVTRALTLLAKLEAADVLRDGAAAAVGAGRMPESAMDGLRERARLSDGPQGPAPPAGLRRVLRKREG